MWLKDKLRWTYFLLTFFLLFKKNFKYIIAPLQVPSLSCHLITASRRHKGYWEILLQRVTCATEIERVVGNPFILSGLLLLLALLLVRRVL